MADITDRSKQRVTISLKKEPGNDKFKFFMKSNSMAGLFNAIAWIVIKTSENLGISVTSTLSYLTYVLVEEGVINGSDSNSVGSIEQNLSDSNS